MKAIINITDKLSFEESPQIQIKDIIVTVNDRAAAILEIMPKMNDFKPENVDEIYKILFNDTDRKKIKGLKLSFKDYIQVIMSAIQLITGNNSGEALTPATI